MPGKGGAYSYRADETVPAWDDTAGLIVFDGECVLCSAFVRFVFRHDRQGRFRFTMAQSTLGQALYRHYGLDPGDFETNLALRNGILHTKMASFAAVMAGLGWPWRALSVVRLIPRPIGNWLYNRIARNRYRLFGRYDACRVPAPELRARVIE